MLDKVLIKSLCTHGVATPGPRWLQTGPGGLGRRSAMLPHDDEPAGWGWRNPCARRGTATLRAGAPAGRPRPGAPRPARGAERLADHALRPAPAGPVVSGRLHLPPGPDPVPRMPGGGPGPGR